MNSIQKSILFSIMIGLTACDDIKTYEESKESDSDSLIVLVPHSSREDTAMDVLSSCPSPIEIVKIDFKKTLDSLHAHADSVFLTGTSKDVRRESTTFLDGAGLVMAEVIENPLGTIVYMKNYRNGILIDLAEYHSNGQYQCKFGFDEDGKRDGLYTCYYSDGRVRVSGEYNHGNEKEWEIRYNKDGLLVK